MSLIQRWQFYLVYALRSLRREGFRTVLAGLSIVFGVLSLVSMQELSGALLDGSLFNDRLQYGGDAQIHTHNMSRPFTTAEVEQIEAWHQTGLIASYSLTSEGTARYLRTTHSGRATFLLQALGIDPTVYPLIGDLTLRDPAQSTPADVLKSPTDAIMTRDLADSLGLHVGDAFLLGGGETVPFKMTIAGIASGTPDAKGKGIYYSLETARLLMNEQDVVTSAAVLWGDAPNAAQTIIDSPFDVFVARTPDQIVQASGAIALFEVMLKGAGVLGLLVGGLGVSNTLQVILARRRLEIAMLKTMGCRYHTLLLMIGLEMGLLALISSLIGAVLGTAVGGILLNTLGGAGTFMLNWSPNLTIMAGGVLAGTSIGIVFGMQAILASSATRPIELLRDSPVRTTRTMTASYGVLFGVAIILFGGLVGLVLGNVILGLGCVILGGALLMVLRSLFWMVLWGLLKLPTPRVPLIRLARANLVQRKTQSSLIIMALFAGVFSITFAALCIHTAFVTVAKQRASDEGYNIAVYTDVDHVRAVSDSVTAQTSTAYTRYQTNGLLNGAPIEIEGRDVTDAGADLVVDGVWDASPDKALLPANDRGPYEIGERVTLEGQTSVTVEIVGFYTASEEYDYLLSSMPEGIVVSPQTASALGGTQTRVVVLASVPAPRLPAVADTLGAALPDVLVFSKADVNDMMISIFRSLFTFAISVAGLAFVAGAVLIANSAGLTIVERQREIGVFKAVGYTSGHVLRLLVGEYTFLGLLGGFFGVIAVIIMVIGMRLALPAANIILEPFIMSGMLALAVLVASVSAVLVVWRSVHVRPLDVLRYE